MGRDNMGTRSSSRSEDDIEKLISRVCTHFVTQLKEELNSKIDKLDEKISKVFDSLASIKSSVQNNSKSIENLQRKYDELDQGCRKNSLRICGFQEEDDEDLLALLPEFFSQKLNISCSSKDIDYVFRLKSDKNGEAPAAIIVNFVQNCTRNKIYMAKKHLKNCPVSVFEDLTRPRYELLLSTKQKFGKKMAWSSAGKIYAWNASSNKKVLIQSKDDLL